MLHSRLQGKTATVHSDVTLMLRIERNYRILRPLEDLNKLTKAMVDLFTLFFSRLLMLQKSISAFHLKCQLVKWPRRWFLIPSWLLVMCRNTMRSLRMKPQVMWEGFESLRFDDGNLNNNASNLWFDGLNEKNIIVLHVRHAFWCNVLT